MVGDVWAAYHRRTCPLDEDDIYYFTDMHKLTMFADYRVPQILRALHVMKYSTELAAAVDGCEEVPFGSEAEVEIRACTVVAVDKLQQALQKRGLNILAVEVDWLLWQKGEAENEAGRLRPHHRTWTIFY